MNKVRPATEAQFGADTWPEQAIIVQNTWLIQRALGYDTARMHMLHPNARCPFLPTPLPFHFKWHTPTTRTHTPLLFQPGLVLLQHPRHGRLDLLRGDL